MTKSAFSNRVWNFMNRHINNVTKYITTFLTYLECHFRRISIDKNICFVGIPKINIGNGGSIVVGRNCKFLSRMTCNNIGLNHKCILSATPYDQEIGCKIDIGSNCGFSGVSIWCFTSIKIGNNVRVGANVLIMDGDAHFDDPRTSPPKPIVIKDNVFIGANVVIKKGVTIGKNSVIGMNSIVTHDIPQNSIAVGNPCKVIKMIEK